MRRLLWLLFLLSCAVYIGWRQQHDRVFETDMLKLLPSWSNDQVVQQARDSVRQQALSQTIFLIGHQDFAQAKQQALQFAEQLQAAQVFVSVQSKLAAPDIKILGDFYAPYADRLLSQQEQQLLTEQTNAERDLLLQHWLSPIGLSLDNDPYGNVARFLQQHNQFSGALSWRDGVLSADYNDKSWVLVRAQTPDKVFDASWQEHAIAAVSQAQQQLSDVDLLWTGMFKFARDARVQTTNEINWISATGTIGLLLLLWIVLRRLYPVWLMLAVIVTSMLGATAFSLLVYDQLHLITYVFGATLIGIAGDYALHFLVHHAASDEQWNAELAMRQLAKPLTTALLTTLLAYLAICLTPFSGFRQMAVFCLFGLIFAYLAVVLALPECLQKAAKQPARGLGLFARLYALVQQAPSRTIRTILFSLVALLILFGFARLKVDDDIHLLQKPAAVLMNEQQIIANITKLEPANQFYLVRADSSEQLLQREEVLSAALTRAQQQQQLKNFRAVSQWLPSQQRQAINQRLLNEASHGGVIQQTLTELGAEPQSLPRSVNDLLPETFFEQGFAQMFAAQWLVDQSRFSSIVTLDGVKNREALQQLAQLDGVQFIDERAAISTLFGEFRQQAIGLVAIAYLLVAGLLWWQRGARQMLRRLLPTLVATALTVALLALIGIALNLFHGVALMLVLGIGVDYALFLSDGEGHEPSSLLAIVLSACTAMLAFGLLAFSHLPAVAGFGLTVLIGVALALLLAPTVFWWANEKTH